MEENSLEQLVNQVLGSPKYSRISPELVQDIGQRELSKGRSLKEAVKATKNKLHQVAGAYLSAIPDYSRWLTDLQSASVQGESALKETCRSLMRRHASTAERLPILDRFYAETLGDIGPQYSVLDVACGFNPLAIPWMGLPEGAHYEAVDIYQDLMEFLQEYFPLVGIIGYAHTIDCLQACPTGLFDLALMLKTIPCLEQVDKNAGRRLLETIHARHLLVSFPARSLGGRSKGMPENYEAHFQELVAGKPWRIRRFVFPSEIAFLIQTELE